MKQTETTTQTINPIDKDKVTEFPGTLPYAHHVGSVAVQPEDVGKLKSRALSAMREQTTRQLLQIQKQAELLAAQANDIRQRVFISEKIYQAKLPFEPFAGNDYHLYEQDGLYRLMLIGPDEWGRSKKESLHFVASVRLLSDHTWEVLTAARNRFDYFEEDAVH
jgi:hypothetical protein